MRRNLVVCSIVLALVPASAEAHGITRGGAWLDEAAFGAVALVLLVIFFVLSGSDKANGPAREGSLELQEHRPSDRSVGHQPD
jgi:hypothetical protein